MLVIRVIDTNSEPISGVEVQTSEWQCTTDLAGEIRVEMETWESFTAQFRKPGFVACCQQVPAGADLLVEIRLITPAILRLHSQS